MTGVFLTPMAWYAQHRKDHLGQLFFYLPNPSVLPELGTAIIVTSAFLTLLYMTIESLKQHASLPRGLYILSIGIQPIFGTISYPIYHLAIFGICHWLIEFALASRILHSQSLAAESRLPAPPQRILRPGFSMWVLVFTLLSVLMYCIFHSRTLHGIVGIGLQSGYNQDSLDIIGLNRSHPGSGDRTQGVGDGKRHAHCATHRQSPSPDPQCPRW